MTRGVPTGKKQPRRAFEPTYGEGELYAVYNLSESSDSQLWNPEDVRTDDKERLERDWRNEGKIPHACVKSREEVLEMLSDFQWMWNGHQGQTTTAQHQIEVSPAKTQQMFSAPYWEVQKQAGFRKTSSTK